MLQSFSTETALSLFSLSPFEKKSYIFESIQSFTITESHTLPQSNLNNSFEFLHISTLQCPVDKKDARPVTNIVEPSVHSIMKNSTKQVCAQSAKQTEMEKVY